MPIKNPASPRAAIAKERIWIEYCIFAQIKMIKAILNPADHLPGVVFGKTFSLILSTQSTETIISYKALITQLRPIHHITCYCRVRENPI